MGGWVVVGGEGAQASIQLRLEQEKPPKVATLNPYHTTRPRRRLANDGNSSRSWLTHSHWTVETLYIDSY